MIYTVAASFKNIRLVLLSSLLLGLPLHLLAQTGDTETEYRSELVDNNKTTVKSPSHRIAMLELYTSEGCSSCPPADRFINNLKASGINPEQIIPLAFHVTYWDYIGWKDRFAKPQFDARQRDLARKNKQKTVYTPQFVLVGDDFRGYGKFNDSVNKIVAEKARVSLSLTVNKQVDALRIRLISGISAAELNGVSLYIAVVENNLSSVVSDGENEGETLLHNYVVRQLSAPYFQSSPENKLSKERVVSLDPEWKRQDLSVVAFAEDMRTGEILQAVQYNF